MVDIKVAILEKDGEEFDDPVEYDSETLVRNILGGVISDYMPRRTTLKLVDTSSNSQGWLRLSDQGISSDRVGYIPPYDCYVKSITFTNRNDGKDDKPLVAEIRAYYTNADSEDRIRTSDSVGWYVDASSAQDNYAYGRRWRYTAPDNQDQLLKDRAYAFRYDELEDREDFSDIYVEIELEEIL
jgi:hypothetical protein